MSDTIVDAARRQVELRSSEDAIVFLQDGEGSGTPLTREELDRRVVALAAGLQDVASQGERVLLVHPPGIDYVVGLLGCMFAGLVPVPAYPPHPARLDRMLPRLQAIAEDARASFVLTPSPLAAMLEGLNLGWDGRSARVLRSDALEATPGGGQSWSPPDIGPDSLAFLQYTSGSTGRPKGVMLEHRHLLHNIAMCSRLAGMDEDSVVASWLPPYHDMGLIGCILGPLVVGGFSVLMSPEAFLRRPARWLETISRFRCDLTAAPNFAYDLCVRKIDGAQRAGLDLSSLAYALSGGEPVHADTLARFTSAFAEYGLANDVLLPVYGLAEGTLLVSGRPYQGDASLLRVDRGELTRGRVVETSVADRAQALVSCGPPQASDSDVAIVDPDTGGRCPEDRVGEILVSGESVAAGYWENPEETRRTFGAQLSEEPGRTYLRTGDLGFVHDGELYVTGRIKDVLIVRGRNHAPQDVERTVEAVDPRLRRGCGAAVSIDSSDGELVVIVHELGGDAAEDLDPLVQAIRRAVNDDHQFAIDGVELIEPRTIHKTSSGKIQRHACRESFLAGALQGIASWRSSRLEQAMSSLTADDISTRSESRVATDPSEQSDGRTADRTPEEIERWLIERLAVELEIPASEIDPDRTLQEYDVDSLKAAGFLGVIEAELGSALPETILWEYPTVRELASFLHGSTPAEST